MDRYETLGTRLAAEGLLLTVAELHGMICGQLCGEKGEYTVALTGKIMGLDSMQSELVTLFHELAADAGQQLRDQEEFSFHPLLPDEDEDIGLQVYALGRWCEGFTLGYAAGCSTGAAALPDEAREVLADFTRIAEVDTDADGEEDESDYIEVVEYVRVAAASLFSADEDAGQNEDEPVH